MDRWIDASGRRRESGSIQRVAVGGWDDEITDTENGEEIATESKLLYFVC